MPGSLIGCWQQRAFKGCACNLNPAVTATDDWANPSSLKKKWTMQTSHRFTGTSGWSSARAISWMLKGKQMGSLRSNEPGANKNRPVPLVSIMCDLLDLIFISSSPPKQNAEPLSAALCVSLTSSFISQKTLNDNPLLKVESSAFSWNLRPTTLFENSW